VKTPEADVHRVAIMDVQTGRVRQHSLAASDLDHLAQARGQKSFLRGAVESHGRQTIQREACGLQDPWTRT